MRPPTFIGVRATPGRFWTTRIASPPVPGIFRISSSSSVLLATSFFSFFPCTTVSKRL